MEISVITFFSFFMYYYNLFSALTNDLFERKTGALEGSLNKLKLTIHRDTTKSKYVFYSNYML
jgi:hypothetical protein